MIKLLQRLQSVRSSNIIFAFVAPFLIYFIATSRNYLPAIKAVLGIEENAWALLFCFLILAVTGITIFSGSLYLLRSIRPDQKETLINKNRKRAQFLFAVSLILLTFLQFFSVLEPYVISVLANSADPRTSDWIIIVDKTFTLSPEFEDRLRQLTIKYSKFAVFLSLSFLSISLLPFHFHKSTMGKFFIYVILAIGFILAFYVLMIAHAGFAVGLMITLRAAFFAYIGASLLGLVWALLTRLRPSANAIYFYTALGIVLIAAAIFFFLQPKQEVALIGTLEGKIGVISGTPQPVVDMVRYGDFLDEPPTKPFKIRSLKNLDQGLNLLTENRISGLIVPIEKTTNYDVVWQTEFLPTSKKNIAITGAVLGFLCLLLVGIGILSNMHPLAVFSDFFVDTIRGIPMLVIILYIGLPLAGSIKSASGGYIDIEMMTRGIIAISIGYSAYMAEIFRAGIEAVPKGQVEAARTLGLREHQVARLIIVPQAIAIVLPALGNEFIAMLKDTSLLSILSIRDLTQRMKEFQAQSFLAFEPFNSAALLYVLLTLLAASGIKSLDRIVNRNRIED